MTHNYNCHTIDHSMAEAQVEIASRLGVKPHEVSIAANDRDNIIYASVGGASTIYAQIAAQLQHAAQRGDKG